MEHDSKLKIGVIGGGPLPVQWNMNYKKHEIFTPYSNEPHEITETVISPDTVVYSLLRHGNKHKKGYEVDYLGNVSSLAQLSCNIIVSVSLAGTLSPMHNISDMVIYDDVLDFRKKSLTFSNAECPMHISVVPMICHPLQRQLQENAEKMDVAYGGTMVVIEGPRYSTLSESKMFKMLGGDLICQTIAPECFLIKECGICWFGVCLITDKDNDDSDELVSTDLIYTNMKKFEEKFASNLLTLFSALRPYNCKCSSHAGNEARIDKSKITKLQ